MERGGAPPFAAVYATDSGRSWLWLLCLPLYGRLRKDEVLDQFVRGQIYGYVRANPGDCYSSIRDSLELSNGVVTYHLDILETEGFVRAEIEGTHKRFFPAGVKVDPGPLLHRLQQQILALLTDRSGLSQKEIAENLEVSRQLAGYHLGELERRGELESRFWGRFRRYYLVAL